MKSLVTATLSRGFRCVIHTKLFRRFCPVRIRSLQPLYAAYLEHVGPFYSDEHKV
jgi:hypothetical protein